MKLDFTRLDRAFNPRSVVVIGDKDKLIWLRAQSTFKGKLYSVQISPRSIKAIEALGVKNYTSLLDVPEPIDLAIVAVPRSATPQVMEDCIQKGVAAAHFFTAGFSETDTEEGKRLENQLVERARQANFYLIGPNCMGIFNPAIGIRQNEEQYTGIKGKAGFISQSGTHARAFAVQGHVEGVDINKSVSFGNGMVLDSPDFLEYFGHDDSIEVIAMYLEGVRDGRRFIEVLRKVSAAKPVVIWKGGRTEEGARAVASHTGSMAVPQAIWDAAIKQCGAVRVKSIGELIDTVKALLYLLPVRGNRVGITGGSGGQSVAFSDAFAEEGLAVPRLSKESYDKLATFFRLIGASYYNPIDPGPLNRNENKRIIEILEKDRNIDNLVVVVAAEPGWRWDTAEELDEQIRLLTDIRSRGNKPLMAVLSLRNPHMIEYAAYISSKLHEGGVPAFSTIERAARALKNALNYYSFRSDFTSQERKPAKIT